MTRKQLFSKPFCLLMLLVGFVYDLVLPFCWGNNPLAETGTLSLLCEDRKFFFWLWAIFSAGTVIVNTQYLYEKYNHKSKFFNTLCALSFVSICGVALTLGHSIDSWNPKRIAHWVATGMFIVFVIAALLLFFLRERKKHKGFLALAAMVVLILLSFVVIFVFVGKSALMEMVPIALMQILLFFVNFTPVVKQ